MGMIDKMLDSGRGSWEWKMEERERLNRELWKKRVVMVINGKEVKVVRGKGRWN